MKTFIFLRSCTFTKVKAILLVAFLLATYSFSASAQYFQRVYATSAPSGDVDHSAFVADVTDRTNALATTGVEDYSTLSVDIGILNLFSASQNIRFAAGDVPAAGTPVTLKIESGESILGVLNQIEVAATNNGNVVGEVITGANLLGLLGGGVLSGGTNVYEVTFIPKNSGGTAVAYNGVRLKLNSTLALGLSAKFYHAYYLKPVTTPVNCDSPVDVLYGVNGSIASLAAGVTNPYALLTGATPRTQINTGVTAGGSISETVLFSGAGAGDVEVTLSIPPTVVSVGLLDGFVINALNNTTNVGSRGVGSLLSLDLLGLFQNGDPVTVRFPTTGAFDRVSISTVGVLSALSNLKIHSVKRILPVPVVTTGTGDLIYTGKMATLSATSLNATDVITWYNSDNASIGTGSPLNVSPTVTSTYSVESNLPGCTAKSGRATSVVTVLPLPVQNTLPGGTKGGAYTETYVATNPTAGRALNFVSPTLTSQTGLTLNLTTGLISGIPTEEGTFNFNVTISDVGPAASGGARIADIGTTPALGDVVTYSYTVTVTGSLPVKLTSFTAKKEGQIAQLNWATTEEVNSESFDVERSNSSKQWVKIGNVKTNGESTSLNRYYFNDQNPVDGENLYRLKMIDKDGTFAYSGIQSVTFNKETISVYPNPVANSETLSIQFKDWNNVKTVKVINAIGKVVFESAGAIIPAIATNQLTAGIYVVQITRKDGQVVNSKFVKL
ncbi:T9SS type A sorting domain-containing protein [Dyadobacter sp. CY312]|uniref:T9SS type A sorting domain-containing protein n=1 Tax=Dyadobacter sp. CY312 TaxID=2907303 RepID=UPI001F212B6C|nr:T9SS type A sorting domain-containing protein [Dyadobacter sp. CY312]MCE7040474.1 T9SS type A sorting domain-containing protein [Dyadobacter sp. CY312]